MSFLMRGGTLYNMLSHIIYNGLNMSKIESRPIPGKTWEYRFFVDFQGNLNDPAVKNAIRGLEAEANRVRVLGNYWITGGSLNVRIQQCVLYRNFRNTVRFLWKWLI